MDTVETTEEIRDLYEKGDSRAFNKAMAKRVPVKENGCIDLGDIVNSLDAVFKPIVADIKNGIPVIEIRDKSLLGKDISFQDIPKTEEFKEWMKYNV